MKIEYDGRYPNLCYGYLVVTIDDIRYNFPPDCMVPGGSAYCTGDWEEVVTEGEWGISEWPENFPEYLKWDVLDAVNKQVRHGCCGGCI